MTKNFDGQSIWIIGASSGIGAALAKALSKEGARLILSARREEKLKEVASHCDHSDQHMTLALDVSDASSWKSAMQSLDAHNTLPDRVIFMAALYEPMPLYKLDMEKAGMLIDVNVKGALYLCDHIVPRFMKRASGQIVLCSSVAGYRGLPNGQPYSMSKAAIHNLAETLYTEAWRHNIDVRAISPGFVKTDLTDKNDFEMPFIIEPEDAAKAIINGLKKKRFNITFPFPFSTIMKVIKLLPDWLYLRALRLKK
jgi:short-subunit dehydrogenase